MKEKNRRRHPERHNKCREGDENRQDKYRDEDEELLKDKASADKKKKISYTIKRNVCN